MISHLGRVRKIPPRFHWVWVLLAVITWGGRQWNQNHLFSPVIFLKGVLLLGLAGAIYATACRRRPGFLFLGFFPLLWLAASQFQWEVCAQMDNAYWIWLAVFLLSELFLFVLTDGRKILTLVAPLWVVLSALFPFSLFQFLSFGWIKDGLFFKKTRWVRYGFPLAGLTVWLFLKRYPPFHFLWYDVFEVFFNDLFISFFFLGWLGALSFSTRKTSWFPAFGPLFLLPLGMIFLSDPEPYSPFRQAVLRWVLVFFAGFGLESFRRDLMDRSWHGRLLWLVLGFAFFGGVL